MASDSELSQLSVSDDVLEQELRQVVKKAHKENAFDDLTLRKVREKAEKNLGLDEGYFKKDEWKLKSKSIVEDQVARCNNNSGDEGEPPTPSKKKARGPANDIPPAKRAKIEKNGDVKSKPKKAPKPAPAKKTRPSEGSEEDKVPEPELAHDSDSSSLSSLIDDGPKPSRKSKKQQKSPDGTKKKARSGSKSGKSSQTSNPDAEKIKELQGWLVRCGVRKMWARELKPYETPKEKIAHLRQMLTDIGMTGRYSKERANHIREQRELQEDLAAVQAGDKAWGADKDKKSGDEEEEEEEPAPKQIARGLQELDFLRDSDGVESD